LAPLGSILEPVGLPKLIQHEMGHCNGLVHPDDDQDEWVEIADADRARIAAIARRQGLRIKGQLDVGPAATRNTEPTTVTSGGDPPKARRDTPPSSARAFSGDGY